MANRKPLSELSPAYRARIERGLAQGKSYSEARGHAPKLSTVTKQPKVVTSPSPAVTKPFTKKALEDLSPAYRKRIERAMDKGYTLSQARGHAKSTELAPALIRASDKLGNKGYLYKEVRKLKNPQLTKLYNEFVKQSELAKANPGDRNLAKKRDNIARELAGQIHNAEGGGDFYAVATWKPETRNRAQKTADYDDAYLDYTEYI